MVIDERERERIWSAAQSSSDAYLFIYLFFLDMNLIRSTYIEEGIEMLV